MHKEKVMLDHFYSKVRPTTNRIIQRAVCRIKDPDCVKVLQKDAMKQFCLAFYELTKIHLPNLERQLPDQQRYIANKYKPSLIDIVYFCELNQVF